MAMQVSIDQAEAKLDYFMECFDCGFHKHFLGGLWQSSPAPPLPKRCAKHSLSHQLRGTVPLAKTFISTLEKRI
jgi:hypothetical protein